MNAQQTNQKQPRKSDSFVEQLRGLSQGVGKTITQDVVGGMAQDALSSLFGGPRSNSGTLRPNQEVNLGAPEPPPPQPQMGAERMPFPFARPRREQFKPQFSQEQIARLRQQETEVARKIDEIRIELKQLIMEIKDHVSSDLTKAVDEQIVDPSIYHITYLDRIKIMLKNMLKQIRESRTWLTTQKSRKKQMGYWAQYKKKGTTFGLSHERTVATQVG